MKSYVLIINTVELFVHELKLATETYIDNFINITNISTAVISLFVDFNIY